MAEAIKLAGGAHKWVDTHDGYKVLLDVPLVAAFSKGTKGISYEGDEKALQEIVDHAQARHKEGDYCPRAFVGHNDPIKKPSMAGFALPNRVGVAKTQNGEKPAVFGHLKIDNATFEQVKAGKLPGISPEISRVNKKITGIALLDTEAPFNEFPNLTVGEEVKDLSAHFSAKEEPSMKTPEELQKELDAALAEIARFKAEKEEAEKKPDEDLKATVNALKENVSKLTMTVDRLQTKPDPKPAQPPEAKMSMDPETAAKFSALTAENAEIKARLDKQESDRKAAEFVAKATAKLAAKIIPDALKEQIASFAADWAAQKDGETKLDKYLAALEPSLKNKPAGAGSESVATMKAADMNDPMVAKFAKEGVDLAEVAKFGAQYDELKRSKQGRFIEFDKEHFIRNRMLAAVAAEDSDNNEDRG